VRAYTGIFRGHDPRDRGGIRNAKFPNTFGRGGVNRPVRDVLGPPEKGFRMLGKRGSVMLFLRGLPENLTQKELKAFILPAIRKGSGRSIGPKAAVSSCTILRMADPMSGTVEFHGLVEIQPAKVAMHAIVELNGRELKGRKVEVRRYHSRSVLRDRRLEAAAATANTTDDSRRERRRNLKIDLVGA
jgi:hypothetical protein